MGRPPGEPASPKPSPAHTAAMLTAAVHQPGHDQQVRTPQAGAGAAARISVCRYWRRRRSSVASNKRSALRAGPPRLPRKRQGDFQLGSGPQCHRVRRRSSQQYSRVMPVGATARKVLYSAQHTRRRRGLAPPTHPQDCRPTELSKNPLKQQSKAVEPSETNPIHKLSLCVPQAARARSIAIASEQHTLLAIRQALWRTSVLTQSLVSRMGPLIMSSRA